MGIPAVIVAVIGAFAVGRVVQWIADARVVMGRRDQRRHR
jgi:hypothetical protein